MIYYQQLFSSLMIDQAIIQSFNNKQRRRNPCSKKMF